MKRDYIEINKKLIPYRMEIILGAEVFILNIKYNKACDLFTIGLENANGETICFAEPVIYGRQLWGDLQYPGGYPALRIIPYDESNGNSSVTWDNLNDTVFLVIDNAEKELIV